MKKLWCWRCKMVIPMLEDHEWVKIQEALKEGLESVKREQHVQKKKLNQVEPLELRFQKALELYERITGFKETNHNALWHHRVSLYGPPCEKCEKPLRTPKASLCAACGTRVNSS